MSQGNTPICIVGNLTDDPSIRYTPSGAAVTSFRIASTPRRWNPQTQQHEDGEGLFLTCNVWRDQAENVAESLSKGMRVIVNGNLRQRSYETREGEKRTVYEVEVEDVGPSLKWATARVERTNRSSGGRGTGTAPQAAYGATGGGYGPTNDDPWGSTPQYDDAPF